ncbi:putative cupin -type protein [Phaeoacremonium minimum UCRPA7]|uniref:Putative cupin-type protein n=1 Tax=Phaeoacremonium minimum (strain UCR-PA7) TaxID=1286976 RepID=R8BQU2_PHAM7|nr:putative cupin -type protein [Phaeoacremonium minimum UCRPA7]EOO01699.1 putative cupin -type protein [Phaeoacremonium minimum UCRPA7]
MAQKSRRDYENEVRGWGFSHVFTWTDGPGLTTHLILRGELTITYPKDENPEKKTFGVGDRIDVDAGRVHEVWVGGEGCTCEGMGHNQLHSHTDALQF